MKFRAIIIDDEFTGINSLQILLERHCPEVKVVAVSRNPVQAIELIENYMPDIVFLDINMPQMTGFEMLNQLKWRNFDLIFSTAYHEFAIKAIKADAFDYLLKPIDPSELKAALERVQLKKNSIDKVSNLDNFLLALNDLRQHSNQKLLVNSKDGILSLDTETVYCLESKSNYTQIALPNNVIVLSSKTLKEYEKVLCQDHSNFMRVHNSFIINLKKIMRYFKTTDSVVLENNMTVPISKSRKEDFLKWLEL